MEPWITQLGVGGIFVIIVLKEVFAFLKNYKSKNNKTTYCGDISREEFESHKKDVQYRSTCDEVVKRMETRFNGMDNQFISMGEQFTEVKGMIRGLRP